MAEKEFLMRKVQFLQTYGSVVPPSIDGGGYFTEGRSNLRKGGELKGHRELQKLNVSLEINKLDCEKILRSCKAFTALEFVSISTFSKF